MKNILTKILFASAAMLALCLTAQAQTWNFESDYVATGFNGAGGVNPAGVWSLRFQASGTEDVRDDNYALLTGHDINFLGAGLDMWTRNSGGTAPWMGMNLTGGNVFGFLNNGESIVAPSSPTIAIIRWTAPATDNYNISYIFTDVQGGGDGSDVYVAKNATDLYGGLIGDLGTTGLGSLPNVALNAGDHINWIVGAGLLGDNAADVVRVFAEVSVVPEPSSVAFIALGVGALALARRRIARN
jgi:hypothetical protein